MLKEKREWCCRCHEEFPVAPKSQPLRMGWLFPLKRVSAKVKRRLYGKTSDYLCGNCWYDILDEIEDEEEN